MRKLNCKDGICSMESLPQRGGGGLRATSSHFLIPISQLSKAIKKRKMTGKGRKTEGQCVSNFEEGKV
jgi:hypothetical protein